jgi:hypothetical protein
MNFNITTKDISLVKALSSNRYPSKGLKETVPIQERNDLLALRRRLRKLSDFFKEKYDDEYGRFLSENSTGNPVGRAGELRRVWSGIFKGSQNKQYAAQISFVVNTINESLDVGLYFGRTSAIGLREVERELLENELLRIGNLFSTAIIENEDLKKRFYDLFQLGFRAEVRENLVTPEQWLENAQQDPRYSSIVISIPPNSFDVIDLELIDFYVSMVIPLMSIIPEKLEILNQVEKRKLGYLTPEQWARKAERLAKIGLDGEKHIMKYEAIRLEKNCASKTGYPYHKALESDSEGYDILSCDLEGNDIFIEVKTTTMPKNHPWSRTFFMSSTEYKFYNENKSKYKLYRVWNIYSDPSVDEIDLEKVDFKNDGFIVSILE